MTKRQNYRDCLTNEMLLKRFKSQFDLVRFAIEAAGARIKAGHDTINPYDDNIVTDVLNDIAEGRMGASPEDEACFECDVELEEVDAEEESAKTKKRVKV